MRVSVQVVDAQPEPARTPPPEAVLIRTLREKPPAISGRQAALAAGISATHWRQIETGWRSYRGHWFEEHGTARTVAAMAFVVGAEPPDLAGAGRDDAAGELGALIREMEGPPPPGMTPRAEARREIARTARARKARRPVTPA